MNARLLSNGVMSKRCRAVTRRIIVEQPSSFSAGIALFRRVRHDYPALDGIFCTNDNLAIGAVFEYQRPGLRVPDDMAIAGFHGHNVGQVMQPQLASVLTSRERYGAHWCRTIAGAAAW